MTTYNIKKTDVTVLVSPEENNNPVKDKVGQQEYEIASKATVSLRFVNNNTKIHTSDKEGWNKGIHTGRTDYFMSINVPINAFKDVQFLTDCKVSMRPWKVRVITNEANIELDEETFRYFNIRDSDRTIQADEMTFVAFEGEGLGYKGKRHGTINLPPNNSNKAISDGDIDFIGQGHIASQSEGTKADDDHFNDFSEDSDYLVKW